MLYFVYNHDILCKFKYSMLMNIFTTFSLTPIPVYTKHDRCPTGNPKDLVAVIVLTTKIYFSEKSERSGK